MCIRDRPVRGTFPAAAVPVVARAGRDRAASGPRRAAGANPPAAVRAGPRRRDSSGRGRAKLISRRAPAFGRATVAQSAERLIRNQQVGGSSPSSGWSWSHGRARIAGERGYRPDRTASREPLGVPGSGTYPRGSGSPSPRGPSAVPGYAGALSPSSRPRPDARPRRRNRALRPASARSSTSRLRGTRRPRSTSSKCSTPWPVLPRR